MKKLSQKGYISVTLIIFGLILAFALYPFDIPKKNPIKAGCFAGEEPTAQEANPIPLPAIEGWLEPNGGKGTPDSGHSKPFVLIRKNVPIHTIDYSSTEHFINYKIENGAEIFYPGEFGEIDFYRDSFISGFYNSHQAPNHKPNAQFRVRLEGLVFFVRSGNISSNFVTDVYQDKERYDAPESAKGYKTEEIFRCAGTGNAVSLDLANPKQAKSPDQSQLQLQWFLFNSQSRGEIAVHCKPAIYLYPSQKQLVNLKVNTKGILSYVDPPYDKNTGWNVTAYPDGRLTINDKRSAINDYPYLYYESKIPETLIKKPTKGWVIEKSQLKNHFTENLPKLDLNPTQTNDFINYWLKALPDSPFYFIGVIDQQNLNQFEPLEITPKPDYINRVRIYFELLNEPKTVAEPVLTNNYELTTSNFHVVEWGGMVKRHDGQFICSE